MFTEGTIWGVGTVLCLLDAGARGATFFLTMPSIKHLSISERSAYQSLEDVVGCKWSAAVVGALQRGVNRPGKLERYIPGISTKVLTERLRKLLDYGLITRDERVGAVPHVEYSLTPTGKKLAGIIEQLHVLESEHREGAGRSKTIQRTE
jgi:DNA-binding HxlR family transcriptional regulator